MFISSVIHFLHTLIINNDNLYSIPATSSEMMKPLLSIPSSSSTTVLPSPSPSLSSTLSSSPNINEISYTSLMQPCIKATPENKKSKPKNTMIQEVDEVEKSFINLSSIISQHFVDKKMDEDDVFGSTIAYQLRKIEEPRKTELKGKIMKILYEF